MYVFICVYTFARSPSDGRQRGRGGWRRFAAASLDEGVGVVDVRSEVDRVPLLLQRCLCVPSYFVCMYVCMYVCMHV